MKDYTFIQNKEIIPEYEEMELGKPDMQGLLIRGYGDLKCAEYIFLEIKDVLPAQKYFNDLLPHITAANISSEKLLDENGDNTAINIAFTGLGLKKLGLSDSILDTFSREFIEGISFQHSKPDFIPERSTLLGDVGKNDPANWSWGNEDHPVHAVLMLYAKNSLKLKAFSAQMSPKSSNGIGIVHTGDTHELPEDTKNIKEHFGFRDGISDPVIRGIKKSFKVNDTKKMIYPGEFILGYRNEYCNFSPSPYIVENGKKIDFGKNGTYVVFRQIEQYVERFWAYNYHHSKEDGATRSEKALMLASKMIGRWPEGQPLVTCPKGDCSMNEDSLNDFNYSHLDRDGVNCPLGAHIRRTNPRDQVHTGRNAAASLEMSNKHRMIRRGRIYGDPIENYDIEKILFDIKNKAWPATGDEIDNPALENKKKDPGQKKKGLHFICLVSDIGRQFEFVQNVWVNTPTFADLSNEVDPIISAPPANNQSPCHEFTTPQKIVRNRYKNVPQFTTVVGGGYFFMPSITALKYIFRIAV